MRFNLFSDRHLEHKSSSLLAHVASENATSNRISYCRVSWKLARSSGEIVKSPYPMRTERSDNSISVHGLWLSEAKVRRSNLVTRTIRPSLKRADPAVAGFLCGRYGACQSRLVEMDGAPEKTIPLTITRRAPGTRYGLRTGNARFSTGSAVYFIPSRLDTNLN
jgi:hypothetical protein